jgi:TonB family protein
VPHRNAVDPSTVAAHSGDPHDCTYRIIPQAPPLEPGDLESSSSAIEVVIVWGGVSVLRAEHLSPPRSFCIGEGTDADFVIGKETLGHARLPLVLHADGATRVVVPRGASARADREGEPVSLAPQTISDYVGARSFPLTDGITIRIQLGDFTFIVRSVAAARRVGAATLTEPAWGRSRWTFASAAIHLGVLGLCYFLPPSSSALSMDRLDTESRLVKYAIEAQQPPDEIPKWIDHADADGGGGPPAEGPSGEAGKPNTPRTSKRAGIPGTSPQIQLTKEELKLVAGTAGIIGILKASSDANTPTSPYGGAQAIGDDPAAAIGKLLGPEIGTSGGLGGLGMVGTGHGGGGNATAAIGLRGLGTRGRGNGDGSGDGDGYGQGAGGYRTRNARVPRIRVEPPDLVGSLSKETIRRYIGRHIAEVRFCYESQMNARPDLQGRVAIKFVISPSGAVMKAAVAQSDVGSARLEQCIADTVRRIDFPAPEGGGLVVVTYPFVLSQTGD